MRLFAEPLTWIFILLSFSFVILYRVKQKSPALHIAHRVMGVSLIVLWCLSAQIIQNFLFWTFEHQFVPVKQKYVEEVEVIVILAGVIKTICQLSEDTGSTVCYFLACL
ncbi:MAG: hypothetical protein N2606_00355 [Candidatus Omnitrophica bacterium]|nr:hypothetical protein [Candidatus Omnitrophota bacterium]